MHEGSQGSIYDIVFPGYIKIGFKFAKLWRAKGIFGRMLYSLHVCVY